MHWDSESYAESQAPYRGHSLPDPEAYGGVEFCYDYDGKIYIQDRTSVPSLVSGWSMARAPITRRRIGSDQSAHTREKELPSLRENFVGCSLVPRFEVYFRDRRDRPHLRTCLRFGRSE